ncbi:YoaK family protein [Danxiaibacter flavus]|uniref:YoaK family protein n=1 Tax=Danxiaibacter flavus TaxID=3049108 RepID=A0ABV3ZJH9_9BACT|nr:YoaK family protein [Chitinophagaceae bacterium DXS]
MAEQGLHINRVTFLLASVAGFCDTVTFVSGDSIFSAHVTGNFIVFAAQIAGNGYHAGGWLKLLTFPVFVLAVMAGGWLADNTSRRYNLLLVESIVLMLCGIAAMFLPLFPAGTEKLLMYFVVMSTVVAMGFQNAFGRLFAKETHGPTTMMTGNVTQASLDLGSLLRKGFTSQPSTQESLKKLSVTIGGFLVGCVAGALLAGWLGLSVLIVPAVAIIICYLHGESDASKFDQ